LKIFSRILSHRFSFGLSSGERRQEEHRGIVGKHKVATVVVGCAVENQEDIVLGELSREDVEENLEARE